MDFGDDSRTGSARDDGDGGTLSKQLGNKGDSASLASLTSTLLPVLIYSAVCLIIFWFFRRKVQRVYSPRSILHSLFAEERSPPLPQGWFNWLKPFWKQGDDFVLNHSSLDAFLFLRYLKVLSLICFVGCCIVWPVLMPLHATGGNGLTELERVTIGNVSDPNTFFAHVAVAWVFFGIVLCSYRDAARLRKVFGDSVKHVWILRDTIDLEHLVDERTKTATRLERAEIQLIKMADRARRRGERAAPALPEHLLPPTDSPHHPAAAIPVSLSDASRPSSPSTSTTPLPTGTPSAPPSPKLSEDPEKHAGFPQTLPDVNGSVAGQWIPADKRPRHRPLGNFLRSVDTIKWTRRRLKALNPAIAKLRRKLHRGTEGRPLESVFIEFATQSDAQRAYQTLAHDKPMFMSPRFIGIRPDEIVWDSLRMNWFRSYGATLRHAGGDCSCHHLLVVQVFLVTTLTSAASAAFSQILKDPLSAKDLLSENLPKASNFYLSYILIQCLAVGAGNLLRLYDLLRHGIMARFVQNPRVKWRVWKRVRPVHWGGWFPVFTNMGVIAISYSCIAPVVLGFASVGMYVIYLVSKYNLLFVEDSSIDTRGLCYPRALKHLLFGLYLSEICLPERGLALCWTTSRGLLALEIEELNRTDDFPSPGLSDIGVADSSPHIFGQDGDEDEEDDGPEHVTLGNRGGSNPGLEGSASLGRTFAKVSWNAYVKAVTAQLHKIGLGPVLERIDAIVRPEYSPTPNPIMRFLHPSTFDSFAHLHELIPKDLPDPTSTYPEDYVFKTYYPPEMWEPAPKLWIPKDEGGVSAQEVEHCARYGKVEATDEGAWLQEDGKVGCEVEQAPFWEERVLY
ncbi:phosphate metabolism protein [Verticillium alfalfae VaMs.102]|uniref:Phosphate metabolism protein n=1 Tax=Verticillium alfalfae (strain VaMs.102 / ATCC MYA-4576 / FGSC 10136) TaxID=526221 RepID=C9SXP2_VERA1|nr:phosphate metabolism protein [Verticillium alfalfae VaMs.102]EEY23432.1 phosphate metabolism protein [Verticillium alfalfae VaMs.102]